MSDPATSTDGRSVAPATGEPLGDVPNLPGEPPGDLPDDLLDGLLTAVCRPEDVATVRAAVQELDPDDLGGLVAVIGDHQPMTIEVAVDVLAEVGVGPGAIADALALDVEDVIVLLGGPLGAPPTPGSGQQARIIEVGSSDSGEVRPDPTIGHVDGDGSDRHEDSSDPAADAAADRADAQPFAVDRDEDRDGIDEEPGEPSAPEVDEPPVTVRIDQAPEDEAVAATVADLEDDPPTTRRLVWALVLFFVLAGALVAAALWWPQ